MMKNIQWKKGICILTVVTMLMQLGAIGIFAGGEESLTSYSKNADLPASQGVQGYNGWYYLYKNAEGNYVEMTGDGVNTYQDGEAKITTGFILPAYEKPSVIAWKAPYTGTVTLEDTDVWRVSAGNGDLTLTILVNQTKKHELVIPATASQSNKYNYSVSVDVQAGDMIYHEFDCGIKNASTQTRLNPTITYTAIDASTPTPTTVPTVTPAPTLDPTPTPTPIPTPTPTPATPLAIYNMVDDINASGEQGYNGWYYMVQGTDGYTNMTDYANGKWSEGDNSVNKIRIAPAYGRATVVGWQAPESGTVTLTTNERFYRLSSHTGGGDVTATIRKNKNALKLENGEPAQWVFSKTQNDADGHNEKYTITGVHVKKGDWLYHILDCGTKNSAAEVHWQPKIIYTAYGETADDEPDAPAVEEDLPEESDLVYEMSADSYPTDAEGQGKGNWYYLYYNTKTKDWAEMEWTGKQFAVLDSNGNPMHFISKYGIIHPATASAAAAAWEAPFSGRVKLTTSTAIHKSGVGADVTVSILHNDKIVWSEDIAGDQTSPEKGLKPVVELDVKQGDWVYFQNYAEKNNSAGVVWYPKVEYLQQTKFMAGGILLSEMKSVEEGHEIECQFYDGGVLTKATKAYLALYNEKGSMMKLSAPAQIVGDGKAVNWKLSFLVEFGQETYNGWELRLMLINGDGVNVNPVRDPELYCVK